jgi:hypothetical protein
MVVASGLFLNFAALLSKGIDEHALILIMIALKTVYRFKVESIANYPYLFCLYLIDSNKVWDNAQARFCMTR